MTLEEIQQAIARLPPEDVAKLRLWLEQLAGPSPTVPHPNPPVQAEPTDEDNDRKAQSESTAEKLGRFAGRAFADLRRRVREK